MARRVSLEQVQVLDADTATNARISGVGVQVLALDPAFAPPSTPQNPAASAQSQTQIDISWSDVGTETSYRVERSANGVSGWADVSGALPADTILYPDTGLIAGTTYYYRVIAVNANGDSAPSTVVSATTLGGGGGGTVEAVLRPPRNRRR